MSSKIESLVENIFQREEDRARKPLAKPGSKPTPVKGDPGVEIISQNPKAKKSKALKPSKFAPLKKAVLEAASKRGVGHVSWDRDPTDREVADGAMDKLKQEPVTPDSLKRAGGDAGALASARAKRVAKNAETARKEKNKATIAAIKKKGNLASQALDNHPNKGKTVKADHPWAKGERKTDAEMKAQRNRVNQAGVQGKTVTKDGQKIPSNKWSAMKSALTNRKLSKASSHQQDVN